MVPHHGDSILRLAEVRDIESWRALQAELVQPRRLPDGLIEAQIRGHAEDERLLIESPLIQELMHEVLAEQMHAAILDVLEVRVGPVPQDVAAAVQTIQVEQRLKELLKFAAGCGDLGLFRARLQS